MISMHYSCKCAWSSGVLDEAIEHSDKTGHFVHIDGTITPQEHTAVLKTIGASAARRAYEFEVMRRARERGLV